MILRPLKTCGSLDTDGSHLLHLCFDNITEYDPDVVLDKNAIFSAFCLKFCFFLMKPIPTLKKIIQNFKVSGCKQFILATFK